MGTARAGEEGEALGMTRWMAETNERSPDGIEPDVILPVQFFPRLRRNTAWTGEQRLMAALLEDALVVCGKPVRSPTARASHLLRETLRWVRSNDRTWMFSFLRVCEALDLDPGATRRGVRLRRAEASPLCGHPGATGDGATPQGGAARPAEAG